MSNLNIPATERSPEINFNFDQHSLRVRGESYPEDVSAFYGPVFAALDGYLEKLGTGTCSFEFELIYFNSSSAKAIMSLLEKLDEAAANGASVTINWHYDAEDDTMQELGEEFSEDIKHAKFQLAKLEIS
jgi:hypothetical protein